MKLTAAEIQISFTFQMNFDLVCFSINGRFVSAGQLNYRNLYGSFIVVSKLRFEFSGLTIHSEVVIHVWTTEWRQLCFDTCSEIYFQIQHSQKVQKSLRFETNKREISHHCFQSVAQFSVNFLSLSTSKCSTNRKVVQF